MCFSPRKGYKTLRRKSQKFSQNLQSSFRQTNPPPKPSLGADALNKSLPLLKKGRQLVTIAGAVDERIAAELSVSSKWYMPHMDGKLLAEISSQLVAGKLKLPDIKTYPFDDFESALHANRERRVRGKLVLELFKPQ